jgi:universal stress protein E
MTEAIHKILLSVKGGASADSPGLRRVVDLARRAPLDVDLFSAVYEPHLQGYLGHDEIYESLRSRLVRERSDELGSLADALAKQGVQCSAAALWGHPHQVIVSRAVAGRADLVVIEGAGLEAELSHDDWQLIATCPVPLLIVRGDGSAAYRNIAAAVDPYQTRGKPQQLDAEILRCARAVQELTSARLTVVHCFTPASLFAPDPALDGAALDDVERTIEATRRDALCALVEQAGLPADSAVLARGRPDVVLAELTARGDADLVVLGTVSRSKLQSLVLGSTAERVLKSASGDVLLTRPPAAS